MKIGKKMEIEINKQINAELYSSYLYLSMSAYFNSLNLKGFAGWMNVQADEERGHAMKFYEYVEDRGGRVILSKIDAPDTEWKSPLAAFQAAYDHELKVTALINGLVNTAMAEKDPASLAMLQWFVTEQVEEEANADEIVQTLKMIKDSTGSLFMLDKKLGKRKAGPGED